MESSHRFGDAYHRRGSHPNFRRLGLLTHVDLGYLDFMDGISMLLGNLQITTIIQNVGYPWILLVSVGLLLRSSQRIYGDDQLEQASRRAETSSYIILYPSIMRRYMIVHAIGPCDVQ